MFERWKCDTSDFPRQQFLSEFDTKIGEYFAHSGVVLVALILNRHNQYVNRFVYDVFVRARPTNQ